jgi:16S rRNA (guanine(966)-N(2))-methyltransferase RsmD
MTARRALPREVRLIGGRFKRSKLPVADRPGLRPTPDRVRETLFNWLGQDLSGWRCLDAYAGSGALGFEAASRGAAEVLLLERERALLASLAETKRRLGATQLRIEAADAVSWMRQGEPGRWDLVFIDPPFDSALAAPSLEAARRLLAPQGVVYLEGARAQPPEALAALGYELLREGRAGAVHFQLMQRSAADRGDAGAAGAGTGLP